MVEIEAIRMRRLFIEDSLFPEWEEDGAAFADQPAML
jgi:hypothetical protein